MSIEEFHDDIDIEQPSLQTYITNTTTTTTTMSSDKKKSTDEDTTFYGLPTPVAPIPGQCLELRVDCVFVPLIANIDTSNNTFSVRFDIDLSWKALGDDEANYLRDKHQYKPTYVPNLVFMNALTQDEVCNVPWQGDAEYQLNKGRNYVRVRYVGTMVNNFDVGAFPFDVQNIVLAVSLSFFDETGVKFVVRNDKSPFVYVPTKYTAVPGFELSRCMGGVISSDGFSVLTAVVQIKRVPRPFIFRIFMPLLALNATTFAIYAIDDDTEKLNVLITALLSFVGMIYILSISVPMAGKSSVLDQYAMLSIIVTAVPMFLIGWEETKGQERTSFMVHATICAIMHGYIAFLMLEKNISMQRAIHCNFKDTITHLKRPNLSFGEEEHHWKDSFAKKKW